MNVTGKGEKISNTEKQVDTTNVSKSIKKDDTINSSEPIKTDDASVVKFSDLGLSDLILKAVLDKGYEIPTPVQAKAIPAVLEGRDVMAAAQTGTGKTAGFTLPILNRLENQTLAIAGEAKVLVLTPTRELAAQVAESVETYGKHLNLRTAVVFGGVNINPQIRKLSKGVDILVGTPGRLLDLYRQKAVRFRDLEVLVLDEADRMLDMGFIHDIRKILQKLPAERQNLMFSATFSEDVRKLAKTIVKNPIEISVTPRNKTADTVKQWLYSVDKKQKPNLLVDLVHRNGWDPVLVFCRTKHGADKLTKILLSEKLSAVAIHGNKSQGARTKALENFKSKNVRILVATDIAARGLDIHQLPYVVNYDLPHVPEDYVHRIGRTGRAGLTGNAISLVSADEFKQLKDIERLTGELIERKGSGGFSPQNPLPESHMPVFKTPKPKSKKPPRFEGYGGPSQEKDGHKSYSQKRYGSSKGNSSFSANRQGSSDGNRSCSQNRYGNSDGNRSSSYNRSGSSEGNSSSYRRNDGADGNRSSSQNRYGNSDGNRSSSYNRSGSSEGNSSS
ncbi:DEAD/DEAH box helicase, partial [bacterium]|nr:DEAD/DEAH box helicase [bacterium]